MTIVDTSVWSVAYRRSKTIQNASEQRAYSLWQSLVADDAAAIIGSVRQELLSGVRTREQFDRPRQTIAEFELLDLDSNTFDLAAHFSNQCQRVGIAAGSIDMMICASAFERDLSILTLDRDFPRYATVLPIDLA